MNTDRITANWAAIVFTAFVVLDSSALLLRSADDANKRGQESTTLSTAKEDEKTAKKPSSLMKRMFKDFRAGACKTSAPTAPNTSWAPRGEAAISVCRP